MIESNGLAISYIRFSTPDQAAGSSYQRQRQRCEDYCVKNSLRLLTDEEHAYFDRGLSAYTGANLDEQTGQLAKLKRHLENGAITKGTTLVVESLDRLSRQSIWQALPRFMELLSAGLIIVTLTDGRVYKVGCSDIDLFASMLVMQRAHEESATKAGRVRAAMELNHRQARADYKPMGNVAPLWLRLKPGWRSHEQDGSAYEEIPERADVVRQVFAWAIEGFGKGVIAQRLNDAKTPSFKGTTWGASSVDKILNNRATIGEYQPHTSRIEGRLRVRRPDGKPPIPNYFPAVISEDTFRLARSATDGRRKSQATNPGKRINVWQGIAKCIHCGTALHLIDKGKAPKGATYLQCYNARKGSCVGKLIRLDQAEKVFALMLLRLPVFALVREHSRQLESELKVCEQALAEQLKLKERFEADYKRAPDLQMILVAARENAASIAELERRSQSLKADLTAEHSMDAAEFMKRLDLESVPSRIAANTLLKRLSVLVYVGRDGYVVSMKGEMRFCMGYDKERGAGFQEKSLWLREHRITGAKHEIAGKVLAQAEPLDFGLPLEAGEFAYGLENHLSEMAYAALPDEGQRLEPGEY